jgi:hypothetical protein
VIHCADLCWCCRELTKANGVLRAKEDMQLSLLDGYETCLHHTALVLQAALNDHDAEERLLPALMLDIKAFELMQQLTPDSKSLLPTDSMQDSKPPGAAEASTAPSSPSGAAAASSNTVPGRSHSSRGGTCRTARCLASISTADVRECRSFTAQQLAGRFFLLSFVGYQGAGDSHRLATHFATRRTRMPGPEAKPHQQIRLTPLSQEVPSARTIKSMGVEPTHLLGVLQRHVI